MDYRRICLYVGYETVQKKKKESMRAWNKNSSYIGLPEVLNGCTNQKKSG